VIIAITHQNIWTPKSRQYILKEELFSCCACAILHKLCLCPSSQILHCGDNVPHSRLSLGLNRSHKIYHPFLKRVVTPSVDLEVAHPSTMAYQSFDTHHMLCNTLLNPDGGLDTTTLCIEYSTPSLSLHNVFLWHPHEHP